MREPWIRRKPRSRIPFTNLLLKGQRLLTQELHRRSFETSKIAGIVEAGYYFQEVVNPHTGEPEPCVCDSFYGSLWWRGKIPINAFCASLCAGKSQGARRWHPPVYTIGSLDEARSILTRPQHARYFESGQLCFRGQTKQYYARRSVPNPFVADDGGLEPLIIAPFWRAYKNDWNNRPAFGYRSSLFPIFADRILNYGIDVDKLVARHREMGFGGLYSDLEDSPFLEDREYFRRWKSIQVEGPFSRDFPLVEQHYGMSTESLDVTFDLPTAFFFATHRFSNTRARGDYAPIEGGHEGVIYCMVLPGLNKTNDLVRSIPAFDHILPLRPLRQQCALAFFGAGNFNEAIGHMDAVLLFQGNCDLGGSPDKAWLFPNRAEDGLYDFLLQLKKEYRSYFREIVEYSF